MMKYFIQNACAVCGADLGKTKISKAEYENYVRRGFNPPVSHGYCQPCGKKALEEWQKVGVER